VTMRSRREFRRNALDGAAALAECPGGTIKSRPDAASGGALRAALTCSFLQDGALLCEVGGEGRQLRSLFREPFESAGLMPAALSASRVRIPEPPGRRFRRHLGTDSGMTRARIPGASGR
jgi:hypothetical protein